MEPGGDNTIQIFERMREGDRAAFDRFFSRHAARLLVYIHYKIGERLRRKVEPTDILQNLYLRLFDHFDAFCAQVKRRGVRRSLVRMADHEITEAYRYHFKVEKRDARREITGTFDQVTGQVGDLSRWIASPATAVSVKLVREEEYRHVMSLLGSLSPVEQHVIVWRLIECLPTTEIAERLGKSRGAVQMMLARARDKLKKLANSKPGESSRSSTDPSREA